MDITIRSSDKVRVQTNCGANFIDINGMEHEQGIRVDAYPHFHYIEIREKGGCLSIFYFSNKRAKKDVNLGWWEDAAVIFSKNEVYHKAT